jgi:type I restriction enzyme R subunit
LFVSTEEATVVSEYVAECYFSNSYQSEAALENDFIRLLQTQGYEYLQIHNEATLITNLRKQLELLNNYTFTGDEWNRFFNERIASSNEGIVEKTRKIQTDHVQILRRDNGTTKNIYLIDYERSFITTGASHQPIEEAGGSHDTLLRCHDSGYGLPLIHAELNDRGVAIREAFTRLTAINEIVFGRLPACFEYVQIFIISMARIRSITQTRRDSVISGKQ